MLALAYAACPRRRPAPFAAVFEVQAVLLAVPFAKAVQMHQPAVIDVGVALLDAVLFALLRKARLHRFGVGVVFEVEKLHVPHVFEEHLVPFRIQHDEHAFEFVQMPPEDDRVAAVARREQSGDALRRDERLFEKVVDAEHAPVLPAEGTEHEQRIAARHVVGGDLGGVRRSV